MDALSAISYEHQRTVSVRKVRCEVEVGGRWGWYLCNPGTVSWEMVREV